MRIYLKLSRNSKLIPFNYQELLTGAIHRWAGKDNEIHGTSGNFSFSWIQNTKAYKNGINLQQDAYFFISSWNVEFIKRIVGNILDDPTLFNGVTVYDVQIQDTPTFAATERLLMASPVLLKLKEGERIRHVTLDDDDFEQVLTDNFKRKLGKVGVPSDGVEIRLDRETNFRQTKLVSYKGVKNRTSLAPITIKGTQEQIAFAWNAGLGNSTGIGFGAIK